MLLMREQSYIFLASRKRARHRTSRKRARHRTWKEEIAVALNEIIAKPLYDEERFAEVGKKNRRNS